MRRRLVLRTTVAAALVMAVAITAEAVSDARRARERWGDTVAVVVAARDLGVGARVDAGAIRTEPRPAAHVPSDARRAPPDDDRLLLELRSGEVLTDRHLESTRSAAITVMPGMRAVGVALDPAAPTVEAGDRVELVLVDDPWLPSSPDVRSVDGVVLTADADNLTVGVSSDEAAEVARVSALGRVLVTRR